MQSPSIILTLSTVVFIAATELSYIKRSPYTKEVTIQSDSTFELGVQSGIDVTIYVKVGLEQGNCFIQQQRNNDSFYRPTVVNAQCTIDSEKIQKLEQSVNMVLTKFHKLMEELSRVLDTWLKTKVHSHIPQKERF